MTPTQILNELLNKAIDHLVTFSNDLLMPFMLFAFLAGMVLRAIIYFTIRREDLFTKELERNVNQFVNNATPTPRDNSFFISCKRLLEKTFYEMFETTALLQRRKPDLLMPLSDRLFLIKQGAAVMVRYTLRQIKFIKYTEAEPKLLQIAKVVIRDNPSFTKVLGIFPAGKINDILNIMPGLFIVGGIFGTFLGIMKALPELSNMNLNDVAGTKAIMDTFLVKIAFAMQTSILGIVLSVTMTVFNAFFNPEKIFMAAVDRFENCLSLIWQQSSHNKLPNEIPNFDEYRDPSEALAEQALNDELKDKTHFVKPSSGNGSSSAPPSRAS